MFIFCSSATFVIVRRSFVYVTGLITSVTFLNSLDSIYQHQQEEIESKMKDSITDLRNMLIKKKVATTANFSQQQKIMDPNSSNFCFG